MPAFDVTRQRQAAAAFLILGSATPLTKSGIVTRSACQIFRGTISDWRRIVSRTDRSNCANGRCSWGRYLEGLEGVAARTIDLDRGLIASLNFYGRVKNRLVATAITGAVIGLIGWFVPNAIGSGHLLAELTLGGQIALFAIPAWFVTHFFLTISSYGTGVPGGIFAPLLVLGALIGLAVGKVAIMAVPTTNVGPAVFAVVGMAAYFTAIVRAPLTGVVLILEMTGNYQQMLPLLISCFFAYAVAEFLKDLPIYEVLLERDLLSGGEPTDLTQPIVMDFTIQEGVPFEGQFVRFLGLPSGCILVR